MTDGEIVREYNQAKDKKAQIQIMSELTCKPKEEIVRVLKENGCEVEEKRRGQKPKAEEKKVDTKTLGSPRKRRSSSALKETKRSGAEEPIQFSSDCETPQSSSSNQTPQSSSSSQTTQSSSSDQTTQSSSGIPEGVRIALKKEAEYASGMIRACREKMEECYKIVREIFEYADAAGISEKDLMR